MIPFTFLKAFIIQVLCVDTRHRDYSDFLRKLGRKAVLEIPQNKHQLAMFHLIPDQAPFVLFVLSHSFVVEHSSIPKNISRFIEGSVVFRKVAVDSDSREKFKSIDLANRSRLP